MRRSRKILVILEVIIIMFAIISEYFAEKPNAKMNLVRQKPVTVDVVLYDFKDKFISLVRQNLENIQKQNEGKVKFNFYDSKGNQATQNEIMSNLAASNQDILFVNLVDTKSTAEVIERFRQKQIPIIFFNREPVPVESIKAYEKAYYVGTDAKEAGMLQGKIIIDLWNNNRSAIDKNNDEVLQYIMLQGQQTSIEAQERTESVILTINKAGIKTERLALSIANWDRELAKASISSLFLQLSNKIEAIIANNDEMAIGAIEALQKYGYNLGDKKKTIIVVGIDATLDAQELIKKGFMEGSVVQDPSEMANAIYKIGMNVFEGNAPLESTQYKFDETGIAVRLPYKEYGG